MNVGIIVHSQSGNTALVAKVISEHLKQAGIESTLELLRTNGAVKPRDRNVGIRNAPTIEGYDALVLGCPVWGSAASPVFTAFVNTLSSLKGKKVVPFVTHGLPFKFLGANRALKKMKTQLEILQADVPEGESVLCFLKPKKARMEETAKRILGKIK